jgi:hypothetical protein
VIEAEVHAACGKSDEQDAGCIPPTSTPRTLACLLDQRLHKGVELPVRDGIAGASRARRCADAHACIPSTVALL